jgi:hypothetical protein
LVNGIVAPLQEPATDLCLDVIQPSFELNGCPRAEASNQKIPCALFKSTGHGRQRNVDPVTQGPCDAPNELRESRRLARITDRSATGKCLGREVEAKNHGDSTGNNESQRPELACLDPCVRRSVYPSCLRDLALAQAKAEARRAIGVP